MTRQTTQSVKTGQGQAARVVEVEALSGGRAAALIVAAVALSVVAALLVSGNGNQATVAEPAGSAADSGSGDPAPAEPAGASDDTPAAEPATADRVAADPTAVGTPVGARAPQTVSVELETEEVVGQLDDGSTYTYWTFDGQVPGPMIRVREGDTVELTLANSAESINIHSIDLHAVNGPGGGAEALQVPPGESKTISFRALNPGVYVYHCATPHIPSHIANGMFGLIVVEPAGGFESVDHEFYVMQSEIYTAEPHGTAGALTFDPDAMLAEDPSYVVFNGQANALTGDHAMQAEVGDTVRLFVGNAGPNLISSFHVIGEIFDRVHDQGAAEASHNVQTTLIPAGGAAWVEFTLDAPGDYLLVDHAISRTIDKGALAILHAEGAEDPAVFDAGEAADDGATEEQPAGGGDEAAYSPGDTIEISMAEFAFEPEELTLPAGEYTFRVVNDGQAPHQLAVGEGDDHGGHFVDTGNLSAGETAEVTATLEPGTYHMACHIPGHTEAGMVGSITVT